MGTKEVLALSNRGGIYLEHGPLGRLRQKYFHILQKWLQPAEHKNHREFPMARMKNTRYETKIRGQKNENAHSALTTDFPYNGLLTLYLLTTEETGFSSNPGLG